MNHVPTPRKEQTIRELVDLLGRGRVAVVTDYRGIGVSNLNALRRRLTEAGVEYHVAKNTLLRIAAREVGKEAIDPLLVGPTAIAVGFDDETKPARILTEYLRTTRTPLSIRGGLLDKSLLGVEEVRQLATMPPRAEVIARLLGGMQAPAVSLVSVLSASLRNLASVLQQRAEQLA
ncbi:MAG: 50S ribosomal protein L10 [Acidobacteria bacterium]|nr:50S ribosomal protein L10 [Acidobacteriota bacterium]